MGEMRLETFAGKPVPAPEVVRGEMWTLDNTGHSKSTWDSHNPAEVEVHRKLFNDLRAKGFVAHKVGKDGKATPEQVLEFDPSLEAIIMSPALVGG
jgi:hypothetical protein